MRTKLSLLIILLLIFSFSKAAYFQNMPYTVNQPDGTTIKCLVSGDEYFNWIHDEGGYTLIQASNGYYYYAVQDGDLVKPSSYVVNSVIPSEVGLSKWVKISKAEYLRRREFRDSYKRNPLYGPSKAPLTGTINNIVIYIRFSDDVEFTTTRQTYDDKLNPTTGNTLKAYFQEVSYNNLTISSTHYPACALTTNLSYLDSHPRAYYQPYNATTNTLGYANETESMNREHTLLVNAITWINANSPVSASLNIDADSDNKVDNVCFIIKGNADGWSDLLWAHRWSLYTQTVNISGKRVYDYTFQPENQVAVSTLCHEMFHALGAPDLYHYTDDGINPVGSWDLMESGSGHMLMYMKYKYSDSTWVSTIPSITTTGTYSLNPSTSSTNNCYKIASMDPNQYFVVEYRKKTAAGTFEANIQGSGLIVYRVDTRENGNADGPPDEVYIYRPGGTLSVDGTISSAYFVSPTRTAINDATNPSSFLQDGSAGGLNISSVTTAGATISFDVTFCTPPTTQSTNFTSSAITNNSATIGYTRGNGNKVIVVVRKAAAVNADPANGVNYTANASYGTGSELGTGNFVIYNGTGNSVTITNLLPGTTYHFAVYEYGTATTCYHTPALIGNFTTTGTAPCSVCASVSTTEWNTSITKVQINTINQISGKTSGYNDYTATPTNLTKGDTYPLTVNLNSDGSYTVSAKAWIDWNNDCDFDDAGESFPLGTVTNSADGATSLSPLNITVPATAATGIVKMRVSCKYDTTPPTSCENAFDGEVEDYALNILGPACTPVAITTQPTSSQTSCTPGGASFTVVAATGTAPITYQWQYYNGTTWNNVVNGTPAGAIYSNATTSTMTVTGITTPATYKYKCYLTNCVGANNATSSNANLVVSTNPSAPVVGTITQPTCATSTGSVVLSGLPTSGTAVWTITQYPGGTTISGSGTSKTITGLAAGTYTFTVANYLNCVSVSTANVVINTAPAVPSAPVVGTITQPTCAVSTGSVILTGLPATGTWTLTRTPGGTTTTGTGTSTTISGLAAGTYTFKVTNAATCVSVASANVVINEAPAVPSAPVVGTITQPTCAIQTGSVILTGLPATGTWTITPSPSGTAITGTGSSKTITGIAPGTYKYTVTNSASCVSAYSTNVVINAAPVVPTAPIIGTITQPSCTTSTGSVVLTGLPATGTWTITPSPSGTAITGSGTSKTITGITPGTYKYTVTNSATCVSAFSANVVINVAPTTPTAPVVGTITQPTCATATGSVILTGLPATGTWTLTRTPGGTTVTGTGVSKTITGLATGTYTFTVTNASTCISPSSANVVINSAPTTPTSPIVGTRTQPVCATPTGSVVLSGLPATGTWTLTRTPGGTITTGTGTSITVSGIPSGTYTYKVTNEATCVSPASANVVINAAPTVPNAPTVGTITQPSCATSTGSVVLSGLPTSGTAVWTITQSPGGTTITGTGTSKTITGLATGTYTFTVTNDVNCVSASTANVVINAAPDVPTAPIVGTITQPTCALSTGSVILSGLPATGTWTLTRTPGGTTTTGTGITTTISGLTAGTYTYKVTNASTCISVASGNIVINTAPTTPTAPVVGAITQPTCASNVGSVVLSGLPSVGTWTLTQTPGGVTTTGTGTSKTITGLASGTYTFTVTNAATCVSTATSNIVINAVSGAPSAPVVGTITQPTCATSTGSVVLSGLPSTGTWTITQNPGGTTTTGTGVTKTISGLAPGTYTFSVTNAAACMSPASSDVVINASPIVPTAPIVGTITQPTCVITTGSVILTGLPATGTWTLTRQPGGATTTGSGTTKTITGLATGTYFYTVKNSTNCVSGASENIVISAASGVPTAPVVGTITQPNCTSSNGSVILSGLPSTGTWTLTQSPSGTTITGTGTSITISDLVAGTFSYTVTNDAGCISSASTNIVITAFTGGPTAPVIGTITQPTCATSTGSVVLSGLPTTGTWTITQNPGGTTTTTGTGASKTITGLTSGTYTFSVTNAVACTSPVSANVVINSSPIVPTAPIIGTITQPTCTTTTGSVILTGLPATGTWTLTRQPGGGTTTGTGTSKTISGLAPGTYYYTVKNSANCSSAASENILINAASGVPTAPVVGTITQPTCALSTGSVILNGLPSTGTWTLTETPGGNITTGTGASYTVTGLATGTYTYTVKNESNCVSTASSNVVINSLPTAPTAPVISTITQPTCAVATGSVILNGLPATGTWTITQTPGGTTTTGTGVTKTITGLANGTYTFTVTNASACVSGSSANVVINASPSTPSAPIIGTITQPTCTTNTGSVVLEGLPASGSWTITRQPGGATTTGSGITKTITGLAPGTYTFTVKNAANCVSSVSQNVVIDAIPVTPTAPTSVLATYNEICNGGSTTLSFTGGNGSDFNWYSGTCGSNLVGTGNNLSVNPNSTTTYYGLWSNSCGNSTCLSVLVTVNDLPEAPQVNVDCSAGIGNAVVSVLSPLGANYQYSLNGGVYQNAPVFNSIPNGDYQITVKLNTCETIGSTFNINCGCVQEPTLNLSETTTNTCGVNPVNIDNNTFGGSATQVSLSHNGNGILNSTTFNSSPFNFIYTPDISDAGNTVVITVTTDNPNGAPCIVAEQTISINVIPIPITPIISLNVFTLTSDAPNGNQWYNQDGIISGANDVSYTATIDGDYYVVVSLLGCNSEHSNTIHVDVTGISDNQITNTINVYPNPASDILNIEIEGETEITKLEIINSIGQLIFKEDFSNKLVVNTKLFAPGVYLLKLENNNRIKLVKVIKE